VCVCVGGGGGGWGGMRVLNMMYEGCTVSSVKMCSYSRHSTALQC